MFGSLVRLATAPVRVAAAVAAPVIAPVAVAAKVAADIAEPVVREIESASREITNDIRSIAR